MCRVDMAILDALYPLLGNRGYGDADGDRPILTKAELCRAETSLTAVGLHGFNGRSWCPAPRRVNHSPLFRSKPRLPTNSTPDKITILAICVRLRRLFHRHSDHRSNPMIATLLHRLRHSRQNRHRGQATAELPRPVRKCPNSSATMEALNSPCLPA